jgi:hypothetical protein
MCPMVNLGVFVQIYADLSTMFAGFRRYLRNVSVDGDNHPTLEFNQDGSLRAAELTVLNLRPGTGGGPSSRIWEQVSLVNSAALPQAGRSYINIHYIAG